MGSIRRCRALLIGTMAAAIVAPLGLATLAAQQDAQPGVRTGAQTSGQPGGGAEAHAAADAATRAGMQAWSSRVWASASHGNGDEVLELLARHPAIEHEGAYAASVASLKANLEAREQRRAEEIDKVRERLERLLDDRDGGDLALSEALRAAVELSELIPSKDRPALMREAPMREVIERGERAAYAARERGDWLSASDLFYRLQLLLEEGDGDRERFNRYREEFMREAQRLGMVRLYAPRRLWELRNERRNAEIERRAVLREAGHLDEDGDDAEQSRADRPLPAYNPVGDDYKEKLDGVHEDMVQQSLLRGSSRHVEQPQLSEVLIGALTSVRTLVKTTDLWEVFPGLADDAARERFLDGLAAEEARLTEAGARAGRADVLGLLPKIMELNRRTVNIPDVALIHEYGNGGMTAMDEFTGIIWPDEIRRFNRNTQGRFVGVGIQIELDPLSNIRVVTPLEGTPAQRAGIRPGDVIKQVNGETAIGFTLDQAVDVITGPVDTQVVLTIERETEEGVKELTFQLTRAEIPIYSVRGWRRTGPREDAWEWFIDPEHRIGYVRISQFNERTDRDFLNAVRQMGEVNGVILDLRHNPGGLLDQAVAVASRFIDSGRVRSFNGRIVTTHDRHDRRVQEERAARGNVPRELAGVPVAVLINRGSASASEIVAGALQDYAQEGEVQAIVIGDRSYGKGSVQNVWPLSGRGVQAAVKVTTLYYHLPGNRMIHRVPGAPDWGVEPDLSVQMLPRQIAEAIQLRMAADVYRLDENGEAVAGDEPPDPDDLLRDGIDLQLQQALVLLQAQVAAARGEAALTERAVRDN